MELTQLQQFANLLKEKIDEISDELQAFDGNTRRLYFYEWKKIRFSRRLLSCNFGNTKMRNEMKYKSIIINGVEANSRVLESKFPWLKVGGFKEAVIEVKDNMLIWKGGYWKYGIWKCGIWEDGLFLGGVWKDGYWKYGIWKGGYWKCGIWEGGTWEGGAWEDGICLS